MAGIFASQGHSVTFISRTWPGQSADEMSAGIHHVRVPGFDHTSRLGVNLLLDLIWGVRVARALKPGDIVICNTVTLPVWLHYLRPSAGKVCVMMGRAPKGQIGFYRGVARIYSPSSYIAGKITSPQAQSRTRVTGYPIDWALHANAAKQNASPVIIGFVGRLHPEKGIELLIRAACVLAAISGLPEWRIRIVGPAGIREGGGGEEWIGALRREASMALGDRVEWLAPEFDAPRLARLYGTMNIFCYPSLAEKGETFGVAVAEAMAARCASIVSALACFSDLVTNNETGLIFDHTAADAAQRLAGSIARLVEDHGFRNDLADRGQRHARRFDYPEVSRQILADLTLLSGAGTEKPR